MSGRRSRPPSRSGCTTERFRHSFKKGALRGPSFFMQAWRRWASALRRLPPKRDRVVVVLPVGLGRSSGILAATRARVAGMGVGREGVGGARVIKREGLYVLLGPGNLRREKDDVRPDVV